MIKNVLFDLDGVLIDAKKWHYQALNEALRTITDYVIPYEEHLRIFDGSPSHVKLHILTERGILKREDHNKILILKQHNTMNLIKMYCRPDPIKIDLMDKLNRYRKGCVSGSIFQTTYEMLVHAGLNCYMEYVQGNEATKFTKPNPAPYLNAMAYMGILPNETLIVEDNPKGFQSGRDSKAFVMKVEEYNDVSFENVSRCIQEVEKNHEQCCYLHQHV